MKPVIGINVEIQGERPKLASVQANYYESISKAGGIPVLIPPCSDDDLQELLPKFDGVMFIGGWDYCPSFYGEDKHDSVEVAHYDRMDFDARLMKACLEIQQLPVLGICAGAQILNIGLEGSLHQDIPTDFPQSTIEHSSKDGWKDGFHIHKVIVEEGSKLSKIYSKKEFDVPTSHHQSVKRAGSGLRVTAKAEDGVIEAVELEDRPFVIGVQWHPERDYEGNVELFTAFVEAAKVSRGALAHNTSSNRR